MSVDVLMPFYGRIDHFQQAVESVRAQTVDDWRLIVVDDVYPDEEAGRWLVGLGDPRIRYVRNETNLRPSRNYIKAVSLSDAEHVVLMGCDDLMGPRYLERVRELLATHPDTDILQPGVAVVDGDGAASRPLADRVKDWYRPRGPYPRTLRGEELAVSLLRGNWTYFPSLVWRRERVARIGFRTDLDVVQDLAMLFAISAEGGTLLVDDQTVFFYRRHAASYSAVTGPDGSKFAQERTAFREAATTSESLWWPRAARAARWHLSSRLHALSALPRARDAASRRSLAEHVLRHWASSAPTDAHL